MGSFSERDLRHFGLKRWKTWVFEFVDFLRFLWFDLLAFMGDISGMNPLKVHLAKQGFYGR